MPSGWRGCAYLDCNEKQVTQCDNCGTAFCSDHGTRGGDREDDRYKGGMVAVPSVCWKCGGFNVDA